MTAPATVLHIPAGVPIDQSVREEHVPLGQANLYVANGRFAHNGGLEKRYGFGQLTLNRLSGSRSVGHRVAALDRTIVATDGSLLDEYSPSLSKWVTRGRVTECGAKRYSVASVSVESVQVADAERAAMAYGNGYYLIASLDTNTTGNLNPIVHVVDATTKKVVFSANPNAGGSALTTLAPRIIVVGTTGIAVWTTSGKVQAATIDLTNVAGGFGSIKDLATDLETSNLFDVLPLTSTFALAYGNTLGGTTRITIKTFAAAIGSALVSQNETTNSAAIQGICLAGADSEELWTVWTFSGSQNVRASARNTSTLASIIAPSTLMTTSTNASATIGSVVSAGRTAAHEIYVVANAGDTNITSWDAASSVRAVNNAGSLVTSRGIPYIGGWRAASRPFSVSGRVYVEMSYDDQSEGVYNVVLVDITGDAASTICLRPVAWVAPRLNRTVASGNARPSIQVSSTMFAHVHTIWSSQRTFSISIAEYDFAAQRHLPLAYAGALRLTGGIQQVFDGENVYEDGFVVPPRVNVNSSGTGITGTFAYTAIYEYMDATGNVVWSSPAPVQSITVSNKQIDLKIRRPTVTWKNGVDASSSVPPQNLRAVRTLLFRTADGGGTYYLVDIDNGSPASGPWSYTDTLSDTTLITRSQLYKVPGALAAAKDRQGVGAVQHACECNGVLVIVDDSGTTLRCYAERVTGEAPWHHDALQQPIEGDGEIVAVASLDGSVIAFKRTSIYVVPVDPPNANVSQGGFGSPRQIAVDIGCIDPRSVVVTGEGVFFQSDRGIEILDRSLQVAAIGRQIQDTYASYPNVTAAVLDARNGLVRFSLAETGSTTVGLDAVFDVRSGGWVGFDEKTGAAARAQSVSAAYVYHSGAWRYVWLEADGTVHWENEATWLDKGSAWVDLEWIPAWVKAELQREHQFWQGVLLLSRKSAAGLLAEFATDWQGFNSSDNKVWTESDIATYSRQVELRWTKRGQAFKTRITDTAPAVVGTGQGLEFIGLSVDLAPHQGPTQGTPRLAEGARR